MMENTSCLLHETCIHWLCHVGRDLGVVFEMGPKFGQ
jgi:hypothetical protein